MNSKSFKEYVLESDADIEQPAPQILEESNIYLDLLLEGQEKWKAGYKRRVVRTTKPEHKKKGYKWRIKGKERSEISIRLYKKKPSYAEFVKQMKRVAGHEYGSR